LWHRASDERFKGVRYCSVWDADKSLRSTPMDFPKGLLLDPKVRAGYGRLARYGLSFDALLYHTQLLELADLARAFPDVLIMLNHIGCPLGIGVYAGKRDEVFKNWQRDLRTLAACPNVVVKLGGMGMHFLGFGFENLPMPPSSDDLVKAWRPYVETCIEAYRLNPAVFYLKFVKRDGMIRTGGIITPIDHFEQLRKDPACKGPKGGLRISYDGLAGRYMRQGAFLDLIRSGYVGAHAETTKHLKTLVEAVLANDRAVVAAIQTGPAPTDDGAVDDDDDE
jgi:hypothetical protein